MRETAILVNMCMLESMDVDSSDFQAEGLGNRTLRTIGLLGIEQLELAYGRRQNPKPHFRTYFILRSIILLVIGISLHIWLFLNNLILVLRPWVEILCRPKDELFCLDLRIDASRST